MPTVIVTDVDEQPQAAATAVQPSKRKQPPDADRRGNRTEKTVKKKEKRPRSSDEPAASEEKLKRAQVAKPPRDPQQRMRKQRAVEDDLEDADPQPKQKKQKKSKKGSEDDEEAADIAQLDAQTQARFLWEAYTGLFGGSFLEQEAFEAKNILKLPEGPSLEARLQAAVPGWKRKFAEAPEKDPPGAPRLLLVSASALRSLELMRQMPTCNRGCRIAKLFSKHIKQDEQVEELQSRAVCVGAGTPNRLTRLAETEALSLDRLEFVVLDLHRDVKKRSILDIPETRGDWWEFFKSHLNARISAGKTRLCMFS